MSLFESAFNGDTKTVRDLLMHRQVYVDVCDSRGLTALHFATYNAHINVVNLLLDFGANVNQFTDDGLTSLAIAFLLYYGNDSRQTINIALEHVDPSRSISKTTHVFETRKPSPRDRTILQSRASTNASRNLISRTSTRNEEKIIPLNESIIVNESSNKSKNLQLY